jgi:hypothetical protein
MLCRLWALPLKGPLPYPLHPQLMLWFTYYKGTFSTFVFASQNRAFMLRSVLRTLRPSRQLTHPPIFHAKAQREISVLLICFVAQLLHLFES